MPHSFPFVLKEWITEMTGILLPKEVTVLKNIKNCHPVSFTTTQYELIFRRKETAIIFRLKEALIDCLPWTQNLSKAISKI